MQVADQLDELQIEEAYTRYYSYVRSIVYRRLRNRDDADDIAQATLLKLAARPELFGGGNLKHWLARVARNAALDELRERQRILVALSDVVRTLPSAETICLDGLSLVQMHSAVHSAVETLPSAQRQVVDLWYLGGLTHVQIAAVTGVPLGTVKTRVRAALKKLQTTLADTLPYPFAARRWSGISVVPPTDVEIVDAQNRQDASRPEPLKKRNEQPNSGKNRSALDRWLCDYPLPGKV